MNFLYDFSTYIFDVDSTICSIEGIDELARFQGVYDQVASLTQLAMDGNIEFEEIFAQRLNLIQPKLNHLEMLGKKYCETISPGFEDFCKQLSAADKTVLLVSGGYAQAIYPLAEKLDIPVDHVYTNKLVFDKNGEYTGYDQTNPLSQNLGKQKLLANLKQSLPQPSVLFGDSVSDLEAQNQVTTFVAFTQWAQREAVLQNTNVQVNSFEFLANQF